MNNTIRRVFKRLSIINKCYILKMCHSDSIRREFTVPQFCNVRVKCPYSIKIEPLNLHQYHNNDKLILTVGPEHKANIRCVIDKENINIQESSEDCPEDIQLLIEAPVKANMDITTTKGNIDLGNFDNESVMLESSTGNIHIGKCHSNTINISTRGNIQNCTVLQAADINIKTTENGNIKMGRVQGLNLEIESERGDIIVESSYCGHSKFITGDGNMDLKNIHQNCIIETTGDGTLNLSGLDGSLRACFNGGSADVKISRLLADSNITMQGNGTLSLRLDKSCFDETHFDIEASKCTVAEGVILNANEKHDGKINLSVQCKNGMVNVSTFSWSEMFLSNFNKNKN